MHNHHFLVFPFQTTKSQSQIWRVKYLKQNISNKSTKNIIVCLVNCYCIQCLFDTTDSLFLKRDLKNLNFGILKGRVYNVSHLKISFSYFTVWPPLLFGSYKHQCQIVQTSTWLRWRDIDIDLFNLWGIDVSGAQSWKTNCGHYLPVLSTLWFIII